MPFEKTEKIWMDGELVPWDEARVHVLTHSLHYGSGVFEGIRTYAAADGPAVFRLTDHIQRLLDSAKLIMMSDPVLARASSSRRASSPCARAASTPATCGRSRTSATARSGSTRCRAR